MTFDDLEFRLRLRHAFGLTTPPRGVLTDDNPYGRMLAEYPPPGFWARRREALHDRARGLYWLYRSRDQWPTIDVYPSWRRRRVIAKATLALLVGRRRPIAFTLESVELVSFNCDAGFESEYGRAYHWEVLSVSHGWRSLAWDISTDTNI